MATVVTSKGREVIAGRMRGSSPTQAEPLNVGWGTGGVAGGPFTAAVTDVAPFSEASESRAVGVSSIVTTTTTNDTYQVVGTITAGGSKTIAEVFLSDSATKPFSTTVASGTAIGSASNTGLTLNASYTPANGSQIQIRTEVLGVTSGSGSTTLVVSRGQNGSTAITTIAANDQVTTGNAPNNSIANSTLYLHGDFSGIALNLNDSIQFTVQTKFS